MSRELIVLRASAIRMRGQVVGAAQPGRQCLIAGYCTLVYTTPGALQRVWEGASAQLLYRYCSTGPCTSTPDCTFRDEARGVPHRGVADHPPPGPDDLRAPPFIPATTPQPHPRRPSTLHHHLLHMRPQQHPPAVPLDACGTPQGDRDGWQGAGTRGGGPDTLALAPRGR